MRFQLGKLQIELSSDEAAICQGWREMLAGWPASEADDGEEPADLRLSLELADSLPPLPDAPPIFVHENAPQPYGVGALSVYRPAEDEYLLAFWQLARLRLRLGRPDEPVTGVVNKACLLLDQLEDVTIKGLAPLIHRRGCFLIHAFAVERDGRALLLVGASGSGKTTTGLALVRQGWRFISNDAVLLQPAAGGVDVWPVPGRIAVRRPTFELLPWLMDMANEDSNPLHDRFFVTLPKGSRVSPQANKAAAVCFPVIVANAHIEIKREKEAAALAKLMECSISQWDREVFPMHFDLLHALSSITDAYVIRLNRDLAQLGKRLAPLVRV